MGRDERMKGGPVLFGMLVDDFLVVAVECARIPLAEPAPVRVVFFEEIDWAFVSHYAAGMLRICDPRNVFGRDGSSVQSLIKL